MTEDDSLFTITEGHLDSGMRGIPVGTCKTSFVDPIEGVHYVGYPVEDLANLEEEDVIYLLLNKRLPTEDESEAFRTELAHRAMEMPTGALRVLESLTPGSGHPMDWLSMGIMALGAADTTGDVRTDSMNLIARMPELMARIFLLRGGKKEIFPTPRSPSTTLTHRLRRSPPSRRARVILGMINEKWNQEGVTPRSLSFLLLSNSMVKRRKIETTTSKVATARMVGLICSRIPENICQGMVR